MDGTIGEIRLFSCNYAPRNWHICDGTLLTIQGNNALYSILGAVYGGDGRVNFALPDLRGVAAIGAGRSQVDSTVTPRQVGGKAGQETLALTMSNFPPHTHYVMCNSNPNSGTSNNPAGNYMGVGGLDTSGQPINNRYANSATAGASMAPAAVGTAGSSQPVNLRQPVLGLNYIICMIGLYPMRG